jgi:hypothetical protein
MTYDREGDKISFGKDILWMFASICLFVALQSVGILLRRIGAREGDLAQFNILVTASGGLCAAMIGYIVARVFFLTRNSGGSDDGPTH